MRGVFVLLLFVYFLVIASTASEASIRTTTASSGLKLVQVITRHGDRVATKPIRAAPAYWYCSANTLAFPADGIAEYSPIKYQNYRSLYINGRQSLLGNCTAGQLSSIGQNQTYQLGALLSTEYITKEGLLSHNYTSSAIYIRSSETNRCQQSARSIMEGMYPGLERAEALSIPIWLIETSEDDMQINIKNCPAVLLKYVEYLLKHPDDVIKIVEPLVPHLHQLSKIFNTSHPMIASLYNYDNCNCRTFHDIALPNGMSNVVFNAIQKSYWEAGAVMFNSSSSITLGAFIGELIDYMDQKIAGRLAESFQLFSGHDTTVAPILSYFQLYDGVWPPYASHIQFNLFSQNSTYYVLMYYNNQLMTIPKCGTSQCEYALFRSIALADIPTNPKAACELSSYLNITLPIYSSFDGNLRAIEDVIVDHYAHLNYPLFGDTATDRSTVLDLAFAFLHSMFEF